MDYKTATIDDIIKWCQENNQVEWLKAKVKETVPCKVYPKVMVDGKKRIDKTATPTIVNRPITFINIKTDFFDKFFPGAIARKGKKPSFYDRIANL